MNKRNLWLDAGIFTTFLPASFVDKWVECAAKGGGYCADRVRCTAD